MTIRLLPCLLLACAWSPDARAAITCAVLSNTNMAYGTAPLPIGPGTTSTQSTSVECTGNGNDRGQRVRVCIGLVSPTAPRQMRLGTSTVTHRIYRDAAYVQEIGATSIKAEKFFDIPLNRDKSDADTLTMYGRLQGSSAGPVAGAYAETVTAQLGWDSSNFTCDVIQPRVTFTWQATTQIISSCTISAANLSFGTVNVLASNVDATTTLGLNCTANAPWKVKLNGGTVTGNVAGRRMGQSGAAPGVINYQLRHTGANGPLWGDETGGTGALTGTGSGASQTLTLYGRVPGGQPTPAIGTYSDTVTATVEF